MIKLTLHQRGSVCIVTIVIAINLIITAIAMVMINVTAIFIIMLYLFRNNSEQYESNYTQFSQLYL